MGDVVKISATGSGISYYPEFVARVLGFYEGQNLDVVVEVFGNGPVVPRDIATGVRDIGFGGIWLPMLYRGRVAEFYPFAQVCDRYSSHLLARQPLPDFSWADVEGKIVLSPGGAPNGHTLLFGLMKRAGCDISNVRMVDDFFAEEATNLFRGGYGDFFLLPAPASDQLIADGVAHEILDGTTFGEIPWSIFYAKKSFLDREDNVAGRFTLAIQQALDWIHGHDPEEAPAIWERFFPSMKPSVFIAEARSMNARGVWARTVRISEAGYANWHDMILESRLINRPMPYDELIDTRPVEWALASIGQAAPEPGAVSR
jgi:NitT/TauT family transport system substrate-binding protein